MGTRFCCKSPMDGKYRDCTEDQYDDLPNNKRKAQMDGSSCEKIVKPTGDCATQDKEKIDLGYKKADKATYDKAKPKTDKYETDYFWCKPEGKHHLFFKSKTTPTTDDPVVITPGGRYSDCTGGPYSKGCTDTEGIIRKVQGCLGTSVDGKFYTKTEEALMSKLNKTSFTKEDVSKICSGTSPEGEQQKPFGIDEQKAYWEELKNEGRITTLGTPLTSTKNNIVVYVYKKNRTTDKKEKITPNEVNWKSSPEIKDALLKNFETYDYIVLHAINPNTPNIPGEVSIMTAGLNQDDDVVISTISAGRWAPAQSTVSYDSDDLVTETIKKILKRRISEQVVTLTKHSSPDPTIKGTDIASTSTTKGGNVSTSTTTTKSTTVGGRSQTQTNTEYKIDTKKLCSYVNPRRDEAIEILVSLKNIPFQKDEKKEEIQSSINQMEKIDCGTVCNSENIVMLSDAKSQISTMMKTPEGIIVGKKLGRLIELISQIEIECDRIKEEQSNYVGSPSTTTVGGTTVSGSKPESMSTTVSGANTEPLATSELKKEEESIPDCTNSVTMLVDYVISGLQDVTTDQTKIDKQKSDLCYCHRTGGFNSMNARTKVGDLFKDKIKSYELKGDLKSKVAPEKQLFRPLLNRKLGWNEIQKLIQGKPVFNVTINSRYIDRNFGTENCYRTLNESINSKVKRHMTEAIKNKRKDVMVESILKDIKGLRK